MDSNRADLAPKSPTPDKQKPPGPKPKLGKINLKGVKNGIGKTIQGLARNIFNKMSAQKLEEKVSFGEFTSSRQDQ